VFLYSAGNTFRKTGLRYLPVSERVRREIREGKAAKGDTTGCGDNFAGGVLASAAMQMKDRHAEKPDLLEACAWGTASGGFACFSMGGAFQESKPGEKREYIEKYYHDYCDQIRGAT
jgi:sugar/nucleoside kinase (ribokinase family)